MEFNQSCESQGLLLIGAGGHAHVIIDTIKMYQRQYDIRGITDKDRTKKGQVVAGIPILGTDEILDGLYESGIRKAFVSVGAVENFIPRLNLYNLAVSTGFELINVIHGKSIISNLAQMGFGNAILANAVISAGSKVGNNCIINTGSIVEHHCIIGDNVHVAPGAIACGGVKIGENSLVGAGSTIVQGVNIGDNCIIGAGSVVLKDVPPHSIVAGVPGRIIGKR